MAATATVSSYLGPPSVAPPSTPAPKTPDPGIIRGPISQPPTGARPAITRVTAPPPTAATATMSRRRSVEMHSTAAFSTTTTTFLSTIPTDPSPIISTQPSGLDSVLLSEPAPGTVSTTRQSSLTRLEIDAEAIEAIEEEGFTFAVDRVKSQDADCAQASVAIPSSGLKPSVARGTEHSSPRYHAHERRLPAAARGSDDPSAKELPAQQELATGRGPGRHERALSPDIVQGQDDDSLRRRSDQQDPILKTQHFRKQDELGRLPPVLRGLKDEDPPGNHAIFLKPRLTGTQFGRIPCTPVTEDIWSNNSTESVAEDDSSDDPDRKHHLKMRRHSRHAQRPSLSQAHAQRKGKGKGHDRGHATPSTPPQQPPVLVVSPDTADLDSRPASRASRAETLQDFGLGNVPPGDNANDWQSEDDAEEFRSALQSGATTPLSHPADPQGTRGYWSTFRNQDVAPVGESSHHHHHRPLSPHDKRPSRPASTKQHSPRDVGAGTDASTPSRGNGIPPSTTVADGQPVPSPKGGAMRQALRFTSKMLPHRHGPSLNAQDRDQEPMTAPVPTMTTEMLAGTLPVMILKTWLDRDEDGHRAVPVLLGNLRFRIKDSVGIKAGGRYTGREMFKIECEYGDGAIKWVVYREIRDFLMLHAHYKAANLGTRVTGLRSSRHVEMPEFPKNSLPYWAREKGTKAETEVAKEKIKDRFGLSEKAPNTDAVPSGGYEPATRATLQQYLVDLIRAVLFRPESNRLCIFFELSALTVALAPRGGFQGKAGFLKILSMKASRRSNQPGILPTTWRQHRSPKWFIVRESYFVSTDGPQDTDIYDVFLLDSDFVIERPKRAYRKGMHLLAGSGHKHKQTDGLNEMLEDEDSKDTSQHTFYVSNAQRRIKLVAKNARQMHQFIVSMERVAMQCPWTSRNRFDSFAPVRLNVAAQWLVDGRDYFWNLSRAINMAKSRIYIHDWWISPEIYLRRPGDERYRLDNLLKRKAEEGVRICIIIYNEVSAKTTPVASAYVKRKLTGLHPNIMVQRSPSHLPSGALYWSHHEKLCVIDEAIAFHGGLDLCFGRWDTSQHILTDEDHSLPTGPDGPVWIGKDYWNERVAEFHDLEKPFDDAFDRSRTPRMPWHDVGLQLVGQPARDFCRHFCQRWNYLLRIKNHSRKMPFLLPPADFTERELVDLKLQGTCEVQICRSVGPWSMGTLSKIEHSIQNAYCKSIQLSEHFVYIENQFFITSTVVDNTPIENGIGDALVNRIIRAHRDGQKWMACVVIPLLPGYTHPIDKPEASSVRLILECQNRTICRGTNSIFSRLRKEGINPDDYITFFSLRTWAKFKNGSLTTEQVYIHGKTMIVDDRLVLCGSANINERSQRGDRDSELVSVIRDTDMIDGTMAGKPFKVGRYAHTLRMRLMREHMGVDVDAIEEDELMLRRPLADASDVALWDPDNEQTEKVNRGITRVKKSSGRELLNETIYNAMGSIAKGIGENVKRDALEIKEMVVHPIDALEGNVQVPAPSDPAMANQWQDTNPDGTVVRGFASSVVPTLEERLLSSRRQSTDTHPDGTPAFSVRHNSEATTLSNAPRARPNGKEKNKLEAAIETHDHRPPTSKEEDKRREKFGVPAAQPSADNLAPTRPSEELLSDEDTDSAAQTRKLLRKHINTKVGSHPWTMPSPTPKIDPNRFHDPLDGHFWNDMWVAVAVHNTQIFRKVFRCVPDDFVTSWAQYKSFANHMDKFSRMDESKGEGVTDTKVTHDQHGSSGGVVGPEGADSKKPQTDVDGYQDHGTSHEDAHVHKAGEPSDATGDDGGKDKSRVDFPTAHGQSQTTLAQTGDTATKSRRNTVSTQNGGKMEHLTSSASIHEGGERNDRKPSSDTEPWAQWELDDMEELLQEVRGHLVLYSTRFLEAEDLANNFLFNQERILPLAIYD